MNAPSRDHDVESEQIAQNDPARDTPGTTLPRVAPGADPAFQQAMDKLMMQVNADNVLDVHAAFRKHADDLINYLQFLDGTIGIGLCGGDPVSSMAAGEASFGGKVKKLTAAHWDHGHELAAVADRLRDTARSYGHTEEDIDQVLRSAEHR